MEYLILTNNGSIGQWPGFAVVRVQGGLDAVYRVLSEHLQNGYELISTPIPANVPLIRSPVRSIILRKTTRKYDARGLIALEKAQERTDVLGIIDEERTRSDLELIDKNQLGRTVRQLTELTEAMFNFPAVSGITTGQEAL